MTDDLDYIKAEAERLPKGTAARFLAALDAMDGATEPMESDSDMNVKRLDSDFVTITISRDCAEYFAERACTNHRACFIEFGGCVDLDCHLEQACRAELEVGR